MKTAPPIIERIEWGTITVAGLRCDHDLKLGPAGHRIWDWSETGTHHIPGIQPADFRELIDANCEAIVLSKGMQSRLHMCPETKTVLDSLGIELHHAETTRAVEIYNGLVRRGVRVGGLFHCTC